MAITGSQQAVARQITEKFGYLNERLDTLADEVNSLEKKIDLVRFRSPELVQGAKCEPASLLCDLASKIRDATNKINTIIDQVRLITSEIEL